MITFNTVNDKIYNKSFETWEELEIWLSQEFNFKNLNK